MFPDDGKEEWAGRAHDGDVWEPPIAVVGLERVDGEQKKGMLGRRAHSVVGDASGVGAADPSGVGEEGIKAAVTALGRGSVSKTHEAKVQLVDRFGDWESGMAEECGRTSSRSMYVPP